MSWITRQKANEIVELTMYPEGLSSYWDKEPQEVVDFARNASKTFLGYATAQEEYRDLGDEFESDSLGEIDEPWADEEYLDASNRTYEFEFRLRDALEEGNLRKVKGFKPLMELAVKNAAFNGTEEQFEQLLKLSTIFEESAVDIVTRKEY